MSTHATRRVIAAIAAVALAGGTSLVAAAPAFAAPDPLPGGAAALGAQFDIDLTLGDYSFPIVSEQSGSVSVGNDDEAAFSDDNVTLADLVFSSITIDSVTTAARADNTGSEAFAAAEGTALNLFGIDVLGLDTAEAEVTCPVGGSPLAHVVTEGFTIFGQPVTVNGDGSVDEPAPVTLGNDVPVNENPADNVDLSGLVLSVDVQQYQYQGADGALAVSLVAVASVSGTFESVEIPFTTAASLILADAICIPPYVPLTATAITPNSGSTAGGNTVTISGEGFTPTTTVIFGTAPATNVVTATDGKSLTATVPAGAAGQTTVTITKLDPDAVPTSVTLGYTYVAPAVPIIPAGDVTTTLAATGLDPMPLAAGSAGVLVLGLLALIATAVIRRRTA